MEATFRLVRANRNERTTSKPNFQLEFPKSDLTIYFPSGISEIFCQMVSTPGPPFEVDHFSRSDRSEFWLNGSRPLYFRLTFRNHNRDWKAEI